MMCCIGFLLAVVAAGQAKAREEIRAKAEGQRIELTADWSAGDGEPQGWTR